MLAEAILGTEIGLDAAAGGGAVGAAISTDGCSKHLYLHGKKLSALTGIGSEAAEASDGFDLLLTMGQAKSTCRERASSFSHEQ